MYISNSPEFNPRWFRFQKPGFPDWIENGSWIPPGERAVYGYARSGLYAILRKLEGDVALIPDYLPPGVVNVFHRTGYDLEFYPVQSDLSPSVEQVKAKLETVDPAVIMFVHYFGFAAETFPTLSKIAQENETFVIEDVARGLFARDTENRLLGSIGDAAVFSLRKVLPVPHGGLVVAPGVELPEPQGAITEGEELIRSVATAGARRLGWAPTPSSNSKSMEIRHLDYETHDVPLPTDLWPPTSPGRLSQIGLCRSSPAKIQYIRQRRYNSLFERVSRIPDIDIISPAPYDGASPYGVVIRVPSGQSDTNRIFSALRQRRLPVEAFRWPLGVSAENLTHYPDAHSLRFSTIVLPTHHQVPETVIDPIVETIEANV